MEYDIARYRTLMEQGIYIKNHFVEKDAEYSEDYKKGFKDCIQIVSNMSDQILSLMRLGVNDFHEADRIPRVIDMEQVDKAIHVSEGKFLEIY